MVAMDYKRIRSIVRTDRYSATKNLKNEILRFLTIQTQILSFLLHH